MENVIITPHVSGSDRDNGGAIFAIFMDNLDRFFRDQPLKNIVDKQKGY
jgi:phosphoglycerate dehydrogenase-like enzyme